MLRRAAAALATTLLACSAEAQTQVTPNTWTLDGESPRATIASVAWIAGTWQGELLGGSADETWLPPSGGSMSGLFRLTMKQSVSLYEILTIREVDGTLVLELKHFNRDLTGWEEKDEKLTFPLVEIHDGEARFEEMTYRRSGDDGLEVYFTQKAPDGSKTEHVFRGKRR